MVKLKKIKLSDQVDCELREREMYMLRGGDGDDLKVCSCGCAYASQGGSNSNDNAEANTKNGLYSDSGTIRCFVENGGGTIDLTLLG